MSKVHVKTGSPHRTGTLSSQSAHAGTTEPFPKGVMCVMCVLCIMTGHMPICTTEPGSPPDRRVPTWNSRSCLPGLACRKPLLVALMAPDRPPLGHGAEGVEATGTQKDGGRRGKNPQERVEWSQPR